MDLNLTGAFIFLGIICGVVGWGVIELALWLFSLITISVT